MFNVNRFSKKPQKFTFDQDHINESAKKYNKLTKTTNHYVNDLINKSKYYNFFFIVSFVSLGALIFYKNK